RAEALEVYRQLAASSPGDGEIAARIAELSADSGIVAPASNPFDSAFDAESDAESGVLPASSSSAHFTESELAGDGDSWDAYIWAAGFSSADSSMSNEFDAPDFGSDLIESDSPEPRDLRLEESSRETADDPDVMHALAAIPEAESELPPDPEPSWRPEPPSAEPDLIAYAPQLPDSDPSPDDASERRGPTVREFFATLGSRRPPEAQPELQSEHQPEPLPAGDAFSNLFPGDTVPDEDSRAAFALSGAVGGPSLPPATAASAGSPVAQSREQEVTSPGAGMAAPSTAASDAGQESEEDIRKFREWLDGLAES
ncbi:MAG: hypothetical protein H0U13_14160, partial [Gemmatimonadaceae bacterium]|nr:hypothetical protein [Gemmatimonadaceae bacterium]